jgi:hypothetical protein
MNVTEHDLGGGQSVIIEWSDYYQTWTGWIEEDASFWFGDTPEEIIETARERRS